MRIIYLDGPGDIVGTYRQWAKGEVDARETSKAFSGEFYDLWKAAHLNAIAISTGSHAGEVCEPNLRVISRARPFRNAGGAGYFVSQFLATCRLSWIALRHRARVVILADRVLWFTFAPLSLLGVKVVAAFHCCYWPKGFRPRGLKDRLLQRLDGFFFRRLAAATIYVSPEGERQVRELAGTLRGPAIQVRAPYYRNSLENLKTPDYHARPFRVLFAGRVEANKGVFTLLDVARRLEQTHPGRFVWEVCGDGSALEALRRRTNESNLQNQFLLRGRLGRDAMMAAFESAHLVVTPTTSGFAEGLNRVCVEAVMSHRPAVVSSTCHAGDVLGESITEVPPDDPRGYIDAILAYATNETKYRNAVAAGPAAVECFFDENYGWHHALRTAIEAATGERLPAAVSRAAETVALEPAGR